MKLFKSVVKDAKRSAVGVLDRFGLIHLLKPKIKVSQLRKIYEERKAIPVQADRRDSIAIILPCYKHSSFLPEALNSIKNQTRLPDELIIINDNSPDNTPEVVRDFIACNKHIKARYISNETNIGQAASINRGVELATSDIFMIMNDDDYLFQNVVEVVMGFLTENPDVHLFGGSSIPLHSDNEVQTAPKSIPTPLSGVVKMTPEDVIRIRDINSLNMTHSSSTFTRVAWQAVGGYYSDKKMRVVPMSDRDFQLRVGACLNVAFTKTVPFAYWRTDSSVDKYLNS